jgi:demethylmenaquinone methyltransferase/2-methoxy-6-polyprenyl-1,4-benzoquinol methylase
VSAPETARTLFAPLGPTYDRAATLLSYGQDNRWRAFLVGLLDVDRESRVVDVATGTGLVAEAVRRRYGCSVVGVDQSPEMLEQARHRLAGDVELVEAQADRLPFPEGSFDALSFTYLLRYVEDPRATLRELARVVRPGGVVAGLEFGLPRGPWRPLWELHVRAVLPGVGRLVGTGWREAGAFLGPSIRGFNERWDAQRLLEAWSDAGIGTLRMRRMSVGGGVVTWGRKRLAQPSTR